MLHSIKVLTFAICLVVFSNTTLAQGINKTISPTQPIEIAYTDTSDTLKKVTLSIDSKASYAHLSLYANDILVIDNFDIYQSGKQEINAVVRLPKQTSSLILKASQGKVFIEKIQITDITDTSLPIFKDITFKAGIDQFNSLKYGGPSVSDIDNDGDYDFIAINHNDITNKLYWNNGDGTVTKHHKDLSQWYMQDLHGASCADYDNDGDLDVVLSVGGGNGKNPSTINFLKNQNGKLVLMTEDVGIFNGARGRGVRWSDMDKDGDLDLMILNERSLDPEELPQHLFYKNNGDGTFSSIRVDGIENAHGPRALLTDLNNDFIDDLVLFHPLSVWQGNGDFTFTNITSQFPKSLSEDKLITAATDIDIDNDGDQDIYLSRGYEFGTGETTPSVDFHPNKKRLDVKLRANKGESVFEFEADNEITFKDLHFTRRNFKDDYPIYLGASKTPYILNTSIDEKLSITTSSAKGWPENINKNGVYIGHLEGNTWKASIYREANIFWSYEFSLEGLQSFNSQFEPLNRIVPDLLLINNNGTFKDVTKSWGIPAIGNHLGVNAGDFNNDGLQDLFLHRWGFIKSKPADYLLLNTGTSFEVTTQHYANDPNDEGHGDMGQAFDFDLDGDIDLLNGSESKGKWYLYENDSNKKGNYALVRVDYSPIHHMDPLGAEVVIKTASNSFKKRVYSSGEIFSQSLLNIVHFGLKNEQDIEEVKITWRNGETVSFKDKKANQLFHTNNLDPKKVCITTPTKKLRVGTSIALSAIFTPSNSNKNIEWISSNPEAISVNQDGIATAHVANQKVTITAKSASKVANLKLKSIPFEKIPLTDIQLDNKSITMTEGGIYELKITKSPELADENEFEWKSTNNSIATVDHLGKITALKEGTATISAYSKNNAKIESSCSVEVNAFIEPHVTLTNGSFLEKPISKSKDLELKIKYHAGTNRKVISAKSGGIKYWLRLFDKNWKIQKDIIRTDKTAVGTAFGTSSMTIPMKDVAPTSQLPEGHFYYVAVSFMNSDGEDVKVAKHPVVIVE